MAWWEAKCAHICVTLVPLECTYVKPHSSTRDWVKNTELQVNCGTPFVLLHLRYSGVGDVNLTEFYVNYTMSFVNALNEEGRFQGGIERPKRGRMSCGERQNCSRLKELDNRKFFVQLCLCGRKGFEKVLRQKMSEGDEKACRDEMKKI